MNRNTQLIAVIVILILALAGFGAFFLLVPQTASQQPTGPQNIPNDQMVTANAEMTGSPKAAVTLVEWGDFECPYCGAEAPVIEQLIQKYGSNPNFNFVFRNFPLPQHTAARPGAEAAAAAGAQGKFWEMYQLLYANQNQWTTTTNPQPFFDQYAAALGLNKEAFDAALSAHTYANLVQADSQQASNFGLDHTPSLFLNGKAINAADFATMSAEIDAALAQAGAGTSTAANASSTKSK